MYVEKKEKKRGISFSKKYAKREERGEGRKEGGGRREGREEKGGEGRGERRENENNYHYFNIILTKL